MSIAAAEGVRVRIKVVAELVAAYVTHNHIQAAQLPELIASLHSAIDQIAHGPVAEVATPDLRPASATEIRRSITPDALMSFIDGKGYKTLKRHLTVHGFTPATYRARYGLPNDYPMTAPSYSEKRSAVAKGIGLGNHIDRGRKAQE